MGTVQIEREHENRRADAYICESFNVHSRSFLTKNWDNLVLINGKTSKPSYKLKVGDRVEVKEENVDEILSDSSYDKITPQNHPLDIVYESDSYIVINKPKGISVHPGVGNSQDTLANYVAGYLTKKGEYDSTIDRAGVVHRLDKPVSGLIVFAKNKEAQKYLQKQFEKHTVQKIYYAKVVLRENTNKEVFEKLPKTKISAATVIDDFVRMGGQELGREWLKAEGYIGRSDVNRRKMIFKPYPFGSAKYALSYFKFLSDTEVLVIIKTGRMYQIRASLEYLGIYIEGDTLFKSLKGGLTPNEISLESVLLSFEEPSGKLAIYRLK